jgi:hypothetical protein
MEELQQNIIKYSNEILDYLLKFKNRSAVLIFSWLLLGLIPAATARETPHALRSLVTIPTWHIIIGIGIIDLRKLAKKE